MKKLTPVSVIVVFLVLGAATYGLVHVFADNYLSSGKTEASSTVVQCSGRHAAHTVVVSSAAVTPTRTQAKLCDRLTIVNKDDTLREVAFGLHEHHTPYDGVTEKALRKNQSLSVTLNRVGTFRFHDHFHDEVSGYFTVSK